MESIEKLFENIWVRRITMTLVVIIVNVIIYSIVAHFINSREKKNSRVFSNKKNRTYLKMFKSIFRYTMIIVTTLIIMQIFGIDTALWA